MGGKGSDQELGYCAMTRREHRADDKRGASCAPCLGRSIGSRLELNTYIALGGRQSGSG